MKSSYYLIFGLMLFSNPVFAQSSGQLSLPSNSNITALELNNAINTALQQKADLNSTVPYLGLNVNQDQLRVDVGGLPQSWEFPNINQAGNHSTAAIAGSVVTPAGTYSGPTNAWPDYGLSGTSLTYNPAKTAVGVLGFVGMGITGSAAETFNGIATNCALAAPACANGHGLNFTNLVGDEQDFNVYSMASGTPTGGITGFGAVLNASAGTMANVNSTAFAALAAGADKWGTLITSGNGTATNAFSYGAQNASGLSNSQIGYWTAINSSGSNIIANEVFDNAGVFHIQTPAAVSLDILGTPLLQTSNAYPASGNTSLTLRLNSPTTGYANSLVTVGAANSGGTGYRSLVVPN